MEDILSQILPIIVIGVGATVVLVAVRSGRRQNRAIREIRASLDDTERRLAELGWRSHGAPRAEAER